MKKNKIYADRRAKTPKAFFILWQVIILLMTTIISASHWLTREEGALVILVTLLVIQSLLLRAGEIKREGNHYVFNRPAFCWTLIVLSAAQIIYVYTRII